MLILLWSRIPTEKERISGEGLTRDPRGVVPVLQPEFSMAPTSLAGVTILVVDDDPGVRELYVMVLQQAGASVMSSGVASEATSLIELQSPDVVITDLRMPRHDGIWLLREIKARRPGLPVILISGHVEESRRHQLLELGFANVLTKPLHLSDLANAVARVVAR